MKPQLDMMFNEPMSRNTDPQTSHDAAERMKPLSGPDRIAVLKEYGLHVILGLTDYELAARMNRQQNSVGKRRGELRDAGLLVSAIDPEGKVMKRPAPSGSGSMVWVITARGLTALHGIDDNGGEE